MPAHSAELKGQKRATKPAGEAFITPEPPHELQASFSFTLGFLEGEAGPDVPFQTERSRVKIVAGCLQTPEQALEAHSPSLLPILPRSPPGRPLPAVWHSRDKLQQ